MHPVTAILGLLLLTGGLAWGRWSVLAAAALVVGAFYATSSQGLSGGFLRRVGRLRWLFLSILLIYGWFTPGVPVWEPLGRYSPSVAGLVAGALRCLNLMIILAAVHWLLSKLGRESLVGGVYWVARPLQVLGLQPQRLAVRLVLTLEYLDRVQETRPALRSAETSEPVLDRLAAWLRSVLETAEGRCHSVMDLAVIQAPGARDWLALSAFVALMVLMGLSLEV